MTTLHVLLAATDNYAMPLAVTGHSMLTHVPPDRDVEIHVIEIGISQANRDRVDRVWRTAHPRLRVVWQTPDTQAFADLKVGRYSQACLGRLLMESLFAEDVERVLYLDCDIIVQTNIAELWDIPIAGSPIWAVRNAGDNDFRDYVLKKVPGIDAPEDSGYFNTGVLLINLPEWRAQDIGRRALEMLRTHGDSFIFPDQDALNAVMAGDWGRLPMKWNKQVLRIGQPETAPFSLPGIVHFTSRKPWEKDYAQRARMVFHNAYLRSGWDPKPKALMTVARLAGSQLWTKKKGGLMRRINKVFAKKT